MIRDIRFPPADDYRLDLDEKHMIYIYMIYDIRDITTNPFRLSRPH
jgi:hypothetical protein